MEREISAGAMLGIVLIALAAIVGIGFGIFAIVKNTSNTGENDMVNSLNRVADSYFDDYDNKIVTGRQLMGVLEFLSDKDYTVLVHPYHWERASGSSLSFSSGSKASKYTGSTSQVVMLQGYYPNYNVSVNNGVTTVAVNSGGIYIVKNKLLGKENALIASGIKNGTLTSSVSFYGGVSDSDAWSTASVTHNGQNFVTRLSFIKKDNSGILYSDNDYTLFKDTNSPVCIKDNTKWKASLLKSKAGATIGIIFEQLSGNS